MFEDITPESILQDMTDRAGLHIDVREGSFVGDMLGTAAYEIWKVYQSLNALIPIAFVDETSGQYIDKRCAEYGITRKSGTKARATAVLLGTDGVKIPKGTILLTSLGLKFVTLEDTVIAEGKAETTIEARQIGTEYNVPANSVTMFSTVILGVDSVTNTAADGGTDIETDADLVNRLHQKLQSAAASGNVAHYRQWAMETPGIGDAKVFPLWDGPGTVKVVLVDQERNPASQEMVEDCLAHIETQRPIGATVTVTGAEKLEITINASISLKSSISIDTVRSTFEHNLTEYIRQLVFTDQPLLYNRVAFILLNIEGVIDYTDLTINGKGENIEIGEEQAPVLGMVELNAV